MVTPYNTAFSAISFQDRSEQIIFLPLLMLRSNESFIFCSILKCEFDSDNLHSQVVRDVVKMAWLFGDQESAIRRQYVSLSTHHNGDVDVEPFEVRLPLFVFITN